MDGVISASADVDPETEDWHWSTPNNGIESAAQLSNRNNGGWAECAWGGGQKGYIYAMRGDCPQTCPKYSNLNKFGAIACGYPPKTALTAGKCKGEDVSYGTDHWI